MSKFLTHKEAMKALIEGKTLVDSNDTNKTISLFKDDDFVNKQGIIVDPDFVNTLYTIQDDPPETVTVTKAQLIQAYEEHVIGIGAGKVRDIGGFQPFLKQLGFK